jgi:hypothetical protein
MCKMLAFIMLEITYCNTFSLAEQSQNVVFSIFSKHHLTGMLLNVLRLIKFSDQFYSNSIMIFIFKRPKIAPLCISIEAPRCRPQLRFGLQSLATKRLTSTLNDIIYYCFRKKNCSKILKVKFFCYF